jgi:hypothetical protein
MCRMEPVDAEERAEPSVNPGRNDLWKALAFGLAFVAMTAFFFLADSGAMNGFGW